MPYFETDCLSVEVREGGIALLWLDVPGRTHNVFNRLFLNDFGKALDRLAADPALRLLIILSRKESGFAAGADLHDFAAIKSPEEASALSEAGQRLFNKLSSLRLPSVAVIHGPCLGGGLELALACDYRVVVDLPGTQLGLPEIELGLIPGWGGSQRLPRVVGLERGLRVILQRQRLNAAQALRWGLADAVEPNRERALETALGPMAERALREGKRPKGRLPLHTWGQRLLESNRVGRWLLFRGVRRVLGRRVPDDMPAPWEAVKTVEVGLREGLEPGLRYEREAIGRLAATPACRNLIALFFLVENVRHPSAAAPEVAASLPQRVGVVGAGTMGAGIAQLAALKGCQVVIQEVNEAALAAGVQRVAALFQKAAQRRLLSAEEARRKLEAIGRTTSWEGFGDLDLVIEAVVEELEPKRQVFRELERRTRPQTILATNTSSLLVGRLQEGLEHPDRVAGLHFFNPVHRMPLVEVVRAAATAEGAVESLTRWAASLGKTPVVVRDSPGFVVNRILAPYLNEAGLLLAEGMPVERVDRVMRRFGMPMGPLELLDQVGLDVATHIARVLASSFGGPFPPDPALERMCRRGWLGQKSGAGFYQYGGKRKVVNPDLREVLEQGNEGNRPAPGGQEAQERMVLVMVNEAAACLGEGLARSADAIDLAMVLGAGWAPHRGGPLRYADDRGAADVVSTLEALARRLGPRFEPSPELRRRAAGGEPFYANFHLPTGDPGTSVP